MHSNGGYRMQNLRRLIAGFFLLVCVAAAQAASLRVTTWNLNWFPSGSPDPIAPELERQRIEEAAAVLKGLESDVIVLQEIRDWDVAELVARALGENYQVAICSKFQDERTGLPGGRQLAILARWPVESSWAKTWRAQSWLQPEGGHVFASIQFGETRVGVFGVHLKNNLTQGDAARDVQLNLLRREICVEELVSVVERFDHQKPGAYGSFVIAGNLNTCPDQDTFVSERTLSVLHEGGFQSGFERIPLVARVTCPGRGRYPDATFDYVWVKRALMDRPPLITAAKLSDHHPVTVEFRIQPPELLALTEQAAGAAWPGRAHPLTVWLPVGLLLAAGLLWLVLRGLRPHADSELALALPDSRSRALDHAGHPTDPAAALVRSSLLPHFARLMADKFVRRLLWQRRHLVENQHATASHVSELEQRLTQLQPKIQARLEAYEKRIAELEHELEGSKHDGAAGHGSGPVNQP